MITPRTSQDASQKEIQVFQKYCDDHNIPNSGPIGEQNVLEIGGFIIDQWKVLIDQDTLDVAVKKLSEAGRIVYYTPAQARYAKIAAENVGRANQLNQWFQTNTILINTGDEGLANQSAILSELRGREINPRTIQEAIGRVSSRSGLHFTPTERKADPRQHRDTGEPFAPKNDSRKYIGGKLNHAYKEPGTQQETPKTSGPIDAWETLCKQMLNHGTHSQQAAFREIYDRAIGHKQWREIYAEMNRLKHSYERVVARGF